MNDDQPPFAVIDTNDGHTTIVIVVPMYAWEKISQGRAISFDANPIGAPVRILLAGAATQQQAIHAVDLLAADPAGVRRAFQEGP